MNAKQFTKGVERLVDPVNVGSLHFIQGLNDYLPKSLQKKMVESSGKKTPKMGFVVEPYSYFLCFKIKDEAKAKAFLPEGYALTKTSIFEDDQPDYYGIIGCFTAHTSGFWGSRVECYIIAEETSTGKLNWIIIDYDTNTITYDPKEGLSNANAKGSLITTDYNGRLYVDMVNKEKRTLEFESDLTLGKNKALDQRLWVEGNLSVAYGKNKITKDPGNFSLTFSPNEFLQALKIPRESLTIAKNTWFSGLFEEEPKELVCFPYAQHFLSDSPGRKGSISHASQLEAAVENTDFSTIKVFSTSGFKFMFLSGGAISLFINLFLLFLLWKK